MTGETSGFDLDLAVSSLMADQGDTALMLRLLTERLAPVLGDRLRVERGGGLWRRRGEVRRVEARLSDEELVAELSGTSPAFSVGHVSGGIRIRTEVLDAAGWLRRLIGGLEREAAHSEATRLALESMFTAGA